MKENGNPAIKANKLPAFAIRAERAMGRAAKNIKSRNRAFNLPLIAWKDGKIVEEPV